MDERIKILGQKSAQGLLSSKIIAEAFARRHDQITKLVDRYLSHFQDFGEVQKEQIKTGGRPTIEYFLNEKHFLFLISLLGNSSDVVEFKTKLIKEYTRLNNNLN